MTTTAKTVTLTEFLLARIAEDEDDALAAVKHQITVREVLSPRWQVVYAWAMLLNDPGVGGSHEFLPGAPSPQRVLAECEAKRRIVNYFRVMRENAGQFDALRLSDADAVLTLLAVPYADHPDYRQEWRP